MSTEIISISGLLAGGLTLVVAAIACVFAYRIPKKIMVNQIYADMVAEYRTPEMGGAILSLFNFYDHCKDNRLDINTEYGTLYDRQLRSPLQQWLNTDERIDFANSLHFQRRLVAQFYFKMAGLYEDCIKLSDKTLKEWFTQGELDLLDIILCLAQPAKNVFINIGEPPEDEAPMYESIRNLYAKVERMLNKAQKRKKCCFRGRKETAQCQSSFVVQTDVLINNSDVRIDNSDVRISNSND